MCRRAHGIFSNLGFHKCFCRAERAAGATAPAAAHTLNFNTSADLISFGLKHYYRVKATDLIPHHNTIFYHLKYKDKGISQSSTVFFP